MAYVEYVDLDLPIYETQALTFACRGGKMKNRIESNFKRIGSKFCGFGFDLFIKRIKISGFELDSFIKRLFSLIHLID